MLCCFPIFQLLEEAADKLGDIVKEFKDKLDFCLAANIPVPPYDLEFFNLRYHFMVGPVPLSLGNIFVYICCGFPFSIL